MSNANDTVQEERFRFSPSTDQENSNFGLTDDEKLSKNDQQVQQTDESPTAVLKTTPAIVRAKQLKSFFQSPTDNVMSPFSQTFAGKGHLSHPALLKQKPKRLNDAPVFKK